MTLLEISKENRRRGALYRGSSLKQRKDLGFRIVAGDSRGAPVTLRDTGMDENGRGFGAANEGGVSRRK